MSILNEPDHVVREHLTDLFQYVDEEGGWADFSVKYGGEYSSGFSELDEALAELYSANEKIHRIANILRVKYGVEF